jgi:lysylphosphatidylglycerol synthetase-like protein (DUF2156 family)
MREPSELAWRLQLAACSITVLLGLVELVLIGTVLSRRRRTPTQPGIVWHVAVIFDIIRLVHVFIVIVAIIVVFAIGWFTTLDLGNLRSAAGVYGTLLWVSEG